MRQSWRLGCLLLLAMAMPATAVEPWKGALACRFDEGTAANHVDGAFKQSKAAPLAFEIGDIDLDRQLARIVTRAGATPEPLRIVRAINANHFIEVLTEGFLGLTTLYDPDAAGVYPAVHSRHVGVFGQAVVAQYTGTCRPK